MRVLHIIPNLDRRSGGPPRFVVDLALAIQRIGIDTLIATTDGAEPAKWGRFSRSNPEVDFPIGWEQLDIRVFRARSPYRVVFSPGLAWTLPSLARQSDVVHIHSMNLFPQFAGLLATRAANKPMVLTPHGALNRVHRSSNDIAKRLASLIWQGRLLKTSSAVHCATMDEYRQASDLVNPSKLIVIPAGVEVPKKCVQHTSGLRARLGIPEDTLIVSSHGRLDPIKRFDLVLGAFAASTMAMPNAHLVIAGPDQHRIRGSLEDLALRLGVANRVHFMGQCTAAEIQELLLESDVWVSASATESLGIAALEALAAGCSTIASAAVPVGVEAAGLGAALLFSHPQELASLMANLLVDERRRSELSRRADEFSRRYNWQHIGPQFVDLYRSLV